jgi:hypothetical protein
MRFRDRLTIVHFRELQGHFRHFQRAVSVLDSELGAVLATSALKAVVDKAGNSGAVCAGVSTQRPAAW